jgi:hypothetical protein
MKLQRENFILYNTHAQPLRVDTSFTRIQMRVLSGPYVTIGRLRMPELRIQTSVSFGHHA